MAGAMGGDAGVGWVSPSTTGVLTTGDRDSGRQRLGPHGHRPRDARCAGVTCGRERQGQSSPDTFRRERSPEDTRLLGFRPPTEAVSPHHRLKPPESGAWGGSPGNPVHQPALPMSRQRGGHLPRPFPPCPPLSASRGPQDHPPAWSGPRPPRGLTGPPGVPVSLPVSLPPPSPDTPSSPLTDRSSRARRSPPTPAPSTPSRPVLPRPPPSLVTVPVGYAAVSARLETRTQGPQR